MFRARPRVIWANRFLGHMRKYNAIYRRPPTYVLWFYQHSTASIYILTDHSIMLTQTVSDDRKNEPFPGNLHIYYRISPQPLCLAEEAPENPGPGAGVSWLVLTSQQLSGPEQHLMSHAQRGWLPLINIFVTDICSRSWSISTSSHFRLFMIRA